MGIRASSVLLIATLLLGACAHVVTREISTDSRMKLTLAERLAMPAAGGHQGDIYSLKFNTLAAFEIARKAGVDVVEMDLHLTKDGIPVVYHDHELSRFTKCKEFVKERTFEELGKCDFLFSNEKIPRFEDVLIWSGGSVIVNAEFKEVAPIDTALALVAKYNAYEWVYFQVKSDEQYARVRSIDKKVNILLMAHNRAELENIMARDDPHILLIEVVKDAVTPENIAYIHAHGKFATKDSWDFDPLQEIFGSVCAEVWKRDIDVAISNRPDGCMAEKEKFLKGKRGH